MEPLVRAEVIMEVQRCFPRSGAKFCMDIPVKDESV
jgi:hypothetical protein